MSTLDSNLTVVAQTGILDTAGRLLGDLESVIFTGAGVAVLAIAVFKIVKAGLGAAAVVSVAIVGGFALWLLGNGLGFFGREIGEEIDQPETVQNSAPAIAQTVPFEQV